MSSKKWQVHEIRWMSVIGTAAYVTFGRYPEPDLDMSIDYFKIRNPLKDWCEVITLRDEYLTGARK